MRFPRKARIGLGTFLAFSIVVLMFPLAAATPARSQGDACVPAAAAVVHSVYTNLGKISSGQVYYANGSLGATFRDGKSSDFKAGTLASLDNVQDLSGKAADVKGADWSIAVWKVRAGLIDDALADVTVAAIGETKLDAVLDPTVKLPLATLTNRNTTAINLYAGPDQSRPITGTLAPLAKVVANGRTEAGDWVRVVQDGALGWLPAKSVSLDRELSELKAVKDTDVTPLYQEAFQALTLKSGANPACKDTPNGLLISSSPGSPARFLVNGVQTGVSGGAFLTASDSELAVSALYGSVTVTVNGVTTPVKTGSTVRIPLKDNQPAGEVGAPAENSGTNYVDLLNSLFKGQEYKGAGSTASGVAINLGSSEVAADALVRLDLGYTGDASACPRPETNPVDVVFALENSDALVGGAAWDDLRAGLLRFGRTTARDTQLGLIAYGATSARTLGKLGEPLSEDTFAEVSFEKTNTIASASVGLTAALSELKGSTQAKPNRVIVLLAFGGGNADSIRTVAKDLKTSGVRILTVGIGSGANRALLADVASSPADVFVIDDTAALRDTLTGIGQAIYQPVAVRDASLVYSYDSAKIEVNPALVTSSGGKALDKNTIEWRFPAIYNGQTVTIPLAIKPIGADASPAGGLKVFYTPCASGGSATSTELLPVGTVKVGAASKDALTAQNGLLVAGSKATGTIGTYGVQNWVVSSPAEQLFSITISGTKKPLSLSLGADATLINSTNEGTQHTSIFYVPSGGTRILRVSSSDPDASGNYTINIKEGLALTPKSEVKLDGDPLTVFPENGIDNFLTVDAGGKIDQPITVRLKAGEPVIDISVLPLRIVSVDGRVSSEIYTIFDGTNNQWISVQQLRGTAPYYASVGMDSAYELTLESADNLTNDRGTVKVGELRRQTPKRGGLEVFKYEIEAEKDTRLSFVTTGAADDLMIRDTTNAAKLFNNQLNVNNLKVNQIDLPKGSYSLYLQAFGNFEISIAEGEILSGLKGALALGQTRSETLPKTQAFAAYRLVVGSGKEIGADSLITINLSATDKLAGDNAFIESADGVRSELTQFVLDQRDTQRQVLVAVHRLQGNPPYRVRVNNLTSYLIRLESGDLLSSNKGALVVGQPARDSSRSPEVIRYTLAPELGKTLTDGDIVTIGFTPQGDSSSSTIASNLVLTLRNGDKRALSPIKSYTPNFGRQIVSLYQLRGEGPFTLELPNLGAYTVTFDQGNTLELDQGLLVMDKPQQARTNGPQLVSYTFDAAADQVVTIRVKDTRGNRNDFRPLLTNGQGVKILPRRQTNNYQYGQSLVYLLRGSGPFRLQFEMDGIYEINLSKGDALTLYKGNFFVGDAETENPGSDQTRLITYTVKLNENQVITTSIDTFYGVALRDPNDNVLRPEIQVYTYNSAYEIRQLFRARKAGVYELAFPSSGRYTLRIENGDQVIKDKGNLYMGAVEKDTLPINVEALRYTLNLESGTQITVDSAIEPVRFSTAPQVPITITNARGDIQQYSEQIGTGYNVRQIYTLEGDGPFTLIYKPRNSGTYRYEDMKFTLAVDLGDKVLLDKGDLAFGTPTTSDTAKSGTRKVSYALDAKPDSAVTISLEKKGQRAFIPVTIVSGAGTALDYTDISVNNNAYLTSFQLKGAGPYHVQFIFDGEYTITASEGNLLTVEQGKLEPDAPVQASLKAPAHAAAYSIEGKEGDLISLQLKQGSNGLYGEVRNADGEYVTVDDQYFDRGLAVYLLRLSGPGPYRLFFFANPNTPYNVTLSKGRDLLNYQAGAIPINPAKFDDPKTKPTVVSGKLPAPARVAFHTIDGKADDLITLQLNVKGGNNPLRPRLVNTEGQVIEPLRSAVDRARTSILYRLAGTAPYTLIFETTNDYEITLTSGDILRVNLGTIPTGKQEKPYQNKVEAPAQIAVHQLDATSGQVITVQMANSGKQFGALVLDGEGNTIKPEIYDFQSGTNVGVYILSGVGPYSLEFPASGQFTASVLAGNLVRIDQGLIAFKQEIKGTLPAPARTGSYTIDGKRDQIVTIQLQTDGTQRLIEFRDSNGKLWSPDFRFTKGTQVFLVYKLSGPPPYTVTFSGRNYTVSINDGNLVRVDRGRVAFGEKISAKLDAPAQIALYTVEAEAGDLVSVQLTSGGRPLDSELRDANGKILKRDTAVVRGNQAVAVYTLAGPGPFVLEFTPTNNFDLIVSKTNVLRVDQGKITLDIPIQATLPAPGQTAIYFFDASEGDTISTELQVSGRPAKSKVLNAKGEEISPDARSEKNNATRSIYTLHGSGPYTLEFDADGQYKVAVAAGNILRAYKGVVRFGNTITDQLKAPAEIAIYTIDAVSGQTISIRVQDNNQPIDSQLRDANGARLQPTGKTNANGSTYSVYTLSGKAPYTVTFLPGGRYSITLTAGTVFDTVRGVIPFGQTVSYTIQPPAQTVTYTVDTEPGQIISAKIERGSQNNNTAVVATLRDKDGKEIAAKTRIVDGRGTIIYVYELTGNGPYTFTFAPTTQYSLTFTRGDASIARFTIFPTLTPTYTPAPSGK